VPAEAETGVPQAGHDNAFGGTDPPQVPHRTVSRSIAASMTCPITLNRRQRSGPPSRVNGAIPGLVLPHWRRQESRHPGADEPGYHDAAKDREARRIRKRTDQEADGSAGGAVAAAVLAAALLADLLEGATDGAFEADGVGEAAAGADGDVEWLGDGDEELGGVDDGGVDEGGVDDGGLEDGGVVCPPVPGPVTGGGLMVAPAFGTGAKIRVAPKKRDQLTVETRTWSPVEGAWTMRPPPT
jgi:hypothetical protein